MASKTLTAPEMPHHATPHASPAPGAAPPQRAARRPTGTGEAPPEFQAYLVLRRQLLEREFAADSPLPSEPELAARLRLPPDPVRGALDRLEREGLIDRRGGDRVFPCDPSAVAYADSAVRSLQDQLAGPAEAPRDLRLLSSRQIVPPPFLNTDQAQFGARVLQVQRLGFHGPRPAHRVTSYVHEEFAALVDPQTLGTRTVLEVLEEAGVAIGRGQVTVTAAAADDLVASHLGVHVGAPLLVTRRLTLTQDGRPLEYFEGFSRPDEYCLQFVTGQARDADPSGARRSAPGTSSRRPDSPTSTDDPARRRRARK